MIHSAFSTVSNSVNDYFRNRFSTTEDRVVVSSLVNPDGTVAVTEPDRVIMTLVNIEHETIGPKGHISSKDLLNLNVYVLFSASFSEGSYLEGLRYLSGILSFFQANRVLSHSNTPDMEPGIDRLSFEIVKQDLQNMSHLWGAIGAKHLPSVLYKMRMVTIKDGAFSFDRPISGLGVNL
ncbi:DUF4255 domain-containing protein [Reichenbachiella carrageenanivorans]|uniref:DUF4255 domain-containing protein n=1 Tax=Reichenbachiella carrageenanivorans TaxID=2979869 RepID=A0ABY6CUW9_9BACT|nr:DUF4255 domain-containing protein [Reichenbachiella carrageenanivorans]UXX77727.1 DUF4255 domain-containing protein [Reichenbachiella carrageenanivorans]